MVPDGCDAKRRGSRKHYERGDIVVVCHMTVAVIRLVRSARDADDRTDMLGPLRCRLARLCGSNTSTGVSVTRVLFGRRVVADRRRPRPRTRLERWRSGGGVLTGRS